MPDLHDLRLSDYAPRPSVAIPGSHVPRPRYRCVDVHNHLGRWLTGDGGWMAPDVGRLLALMDEHDVAAIVNLDGMWGEEMSANLDRYDRAHPGRFLTFCQLDWDLLRERDGVDRLVGSLEDSHARGARGLKVWKTLGLHYKMPWPQRENESGRPFRRSPLYDRLKARGAWFGNKMGWDRPNWFAGIGKAGNPAVMAGVTPGLVVGVTTEAIAGEGLIVTAGGIDAHIHYICPQQVYEALASGVTGAS